MDVVFEALFFLAIALIAITITVYVLAVSLLGRAIQISIKEQAEAEEKGKKEQFIIKSFEDLLEESNTDEEFNKIIMENLEIVTDLNGKKQLYAQLKNVVLPKALEDSRTALIMFKDIVRNLA